MLICGFGTAGDCNIFNHFNRHVDKNLFNILAIVPKDWPLDMDGVSDKI